ncbi:hypothetical protein FGG08_005399 [Glutinoglossum americanum]|uniref:UBR-type domain-containing protein n=1 Tax=Glutinoglossum americanum TaxID=1670608 RepID=A0A9P8I0E4_9PEZI|nr:hypothetical protein FGG08_005399 [Glutinoglossum americanum]
MAQVEVVDANGKGPSSQTGIASHEPQTAEEYINHQLLLEEEAREALPYAFDTCTRPLGPLRQSLFSCLTCNPPPTSSSEPYNAAGICYSCSISCHGEHTLVELFNKRKFVCDCGTTRFSLNSPCKLRIDPKTGTKGVHSETPEEGNHYDHNFRNRFCGCEIEYNAFSEKGTMFQCLGLGSVEDGGCGEDWYHPGCIVGLDRDWYEQQKASKPGGAAQDLKEGKADRTQVENTPRTQNDQNPETLANPAPNPNAAVDDSDDEETPLPPGFPEEDEFDTFICYKCIAANPWIKRYAGTEGFLPAVYKKDTAKTTSEPDNTQDKILEAANISNSATLPDRSTHQTDPSKKRKAEDDDPQTPEEPSTKKLKAEESQPALPPPCVYETLPPPPAGTLSLFLTPNFRAHLCRCPIHFPLLAPHPPLLEEEPIYEPPLSASGDGDGTSAAPSVSNSLLDRGERALGSIDRVRAIEGAMVYNRLKEKVKDFLKPFAETGKAVGAEDIKRYFEELRGDADAVKEARERAKAAAGGSEGGDGSGSGGGKREQEAEIKFPNLPASNA